MNHLPEHPDPIYGRKTELSKVWHLLQTEGVCAIGGLPGIGKSRLAWAVGEVHQGRAIWVDAQAQPAEMLERLIAEGLDSNQPVVQELTDRDLIILDDVAYPEQLRKWALTLHRSTEAMFVFTARWEDADVVLGQLSRDAAVECFMHHARRIDPTLGLKARDREDLAAVASAYGGWPLALRLASQQMAVTTPGELRAQVESMEIDHSSLRQVISVTWDGWSVDQRSRVARLATFEGFISTGAAAALLECADHKAAETLRGLANAGVARRRVFRGEPGVVLSPPLREYARESIEADELEIVQQLVSDYLLRITRTALAEDSVVLRSVVLQHGPDFARAIHREAPTNPELAVELAYTLIMGSAEFGSPWVNEIHEVVANLVDEVTPRSRARANWIIGCRERTAGLVESAEAAWEASLAETDEELVRIRSLIGLAELNVWTKPDRVEALLGQLPDSLSERRLASAEHVRGVAAYVRGDLESTRTHLLDAMLKFDALGDAPGRSRANWYLAVMEHQLFDFEAARHRYAAALADAESIVGNTNVFRFGMGLAELEADQGRFERALLEASKLRLRAQGDVWAEQRLDLFEASVLILRRRMNDAEARVSRAYDSDVPLAPHEGWRQLLSGYIAVSRFEFDRAERAFEQVSELASRPYEEPLRRFAAASLDILAIARGDEASHCAAYEWESQLLYQEVRRVLETATSVQAALAEDNLESAQFRAAVHDQGGHPRARGTLDVRLVRMVLVAAFTKAIGGWPESPEADLVVGPGGHWFSAQGERVELEGRRALPRILSALATTANDADTSIDVWTLVEAGWPGETIEPESAASRVYTSIARLRRLGLRDFLVTRGEGYALSGVVEVRSNRG